MTGKAGRVVDWLLEKDDPGVRAYTLRDVLGAPADDREVLQARRATTRHAPVRQILEAQKKPGYWEKPGPGYSPKYRGTVWSVIFLGQFGAEGDEPRVRAAADYVLEHSRSPYGGFSANAAPSAMIHCLQGNLCASLLDLGYGEDSRLRQALDWLARSIVGEGIGSAADRGAEERYYLSGNCGPGFLCSANLKKACAWGATAAMDALSRVPSLLRTPVMRRAIKAGVDFLFSVDPASAAYPRRPGTKPNLSWFKFGYPMGYVADVLRSADVLTGLGRGGDRRLQATAELILSKRDEEGRWPLEYSYEGKMWSGIGDKRQPNKWVTLRAMRVLKRMGVSA
jgi:hypothetical protein